MASSQRAVLLLPRLRAVISTPLSRHQLPTTAGLGSGLPPPSDGHRGPSKSPLCSQPPCIQRQHLPLDSGPSAPVAAAPPLLYARRALQSSKPPHTHLRETGGGQSVPSLTMRCGDDLNSCLPQAFFPQDLSATSLYLQISSGLRSQPVCTFNCLGAKPVDFSESLSTLTSLYKRQ